MSSTLIHLYDNSCRLVLFPHYSYSITLYSIIFSIIYLKHFIFLSYQILRRVPQSVLWLLDPKPPHTSSTNNSASAKANILKAASAAGILPSRLIFAARTSKVAHIVRHAAADLFLDSFVYGAHSTATDALRGVSIL